MRTLLEASGKAVPCLIAEVKEPFGCSSSLIIMLHEAIPAVLCPSDDSAWIKSEDPEVATGHH